MLIGARNTDDFTPNQKRSYDIIASGPRNDVPYPFLAMLDAPGLANAIQAVGAEIRFAGTLSSELREIAILSTAGAFGSGYEWDYHAAIARELSVSEETIIATLHGLPEDQETNDITGLVVRLCRAAIRERQIPLDILARVVDSIGRAAASEIVAICGYYSMLGLFLSAGQLDHPLPKSD